MESLWEIAEAALEDYNREILDTKINNKVSENVCIHDFDISNTCIHCGLILSNINISHEAEWNNYKDDSGNYCKILKEVIYILILIHIQKVEQFHFLQIH